MAPAVTPAYPRNVLYK